MLACMRESVCSHERVHRYINERLSMNVDKLGREALISAAKTSMSSKILSIDSDFFATLAVDSVQQVKNVNALGQVWSVSACAWRVGAGGRTAAFQNAAAQWMGSARPGCAVPSALQTLDRALCAVVCGQTDRHTEGEREPARQTETNTDMHASVQAKYPLKAINILKAHGKSSSESRLITGYALNNCRASQAMPTSVSKAKIALLDYDLRKFKMSLGVQVPWRMSARGLARTHCACGGAHLHLRAHV